MVVFHLTNMSSGATFIAIHVAEKKCESKGPPRKPPGNGRSNSMGWKKNIIMLGWKKRCGNFLEGIFCITCDKISTFFPRFFARLSTCILFGLSAKTSNFTTFFFRTQVRVGGGRFSQKNRALVTEIPKRSENSLRMNFFEPPKIGWFVVLCVFLSKGKEWGLDEGAAVGALGLVANRLDPTRCPLKSSRNTSSHTWGEWCFGYIFGSKYGCFQK